LSTYAHYEIAQLAAVADTLPLAICARRAPGGELVYANSTFREMVGAPSEGEWAQAHEIRTRGGARCPEDRLPFARAVRERRAVTDEDLVIHRADGRRIFVHALAQPIFDGAGSASHVVLALTNVTAAVEAQSRADLFERRLLHLLEHAPLILFGFDRRGIVTLSEGRGLRALGFRPKELVGRSVYELYANDPALLANVDRALAGQQFTVDSDVGSIVLETTFTPIRNASGEVEGAIGVSIDVTERMKVQSRLLQVERLGSMGTLSAAIAHEINNPLSYILGNLELIETALCGGDVAARAGRRTSIQQRL